MKLTINRSVWVALAGLLAGELDIMSALPGGTIWVSPLGDDRNPGTELEPLATLERALRQGREMRRLQHPGAAEGISIRMAGGHYPLLQPLALRAEDSGTAAAPTRIVAAAGERPVLSGGVRVSDWRALAEAAPEQLSEYRQRHGIAEDALASIWVTDSPRIGPRRMEFRDLWVNGRRADLARDRYDAQMQEIRIWDRERREAWIPAPAGDWSAGPGTLEMVVHQMWAVAMLRVKTMELHGDMARLTFHEPESSLQFEKPWPFVWIRGEGNDSVYYLTNSLQLLNRPGEWYHDWERGQLYYWPLPGEDMASAEVIAPHLETLVRIRASADQPIAQVHFEGIEFSHTTWMRPARFGHVPLQAGFYMYEAYSLLPERGTAGNPRLCNQAWLGRKPAAVEAEGLQHSSFIGCHFTRLGSAGLDIIRASHANRIVGNRFRDIAGNGIVIGNFLEHGVEAHLPYSPADERQICSDNTIANNYLSDIANVDWGCVAILAGFVRSTVIEHNEIRDVSYTGISLGWGWVEQISGAADNHIRNNHVHHFGKHMYDTAAIYTLSAQPGSSITGNSLHSIHRPPYVHDPHHWSFIYLDEGSSYFIIADNWTEAAKFSTNRNGPGNIWRNTGPHAPALVRQNAGLQAPFRSLLAQ